MARSLIPSRPRRGHGAAAPKALAASAALLSLLSAPATAGATDAYGFSSPDAAVLDGYVLFVANHGANSVTEVNASTGGYIGSLGGAAYHFNGPTALKLVGQDLFVANGTGNSVTELNARSGALVRVIAGADYRFSGPVALATQGSRWLFVLSSGGAVTKIAISSGKLGAVAAGSVTAFNKPTAIVDVGAHLFVANSAGNSVTVLNAQTMAPVRVLTNTAGAKTKAFDMPIGMVAEGDNVWVTNQAGTSVTELSAGDGAVVQVIGNWDDYLPSPGAITYGDGYFFVTSPPGSSPMVTQVVPSDPAKLPWMMCNTNGPYTFSNPQALVVYGPDLWVVNEGGAGGPAGNSLTEMNASSGDLVQVVR